MNMFDDLRKNYVPEHAPRLDEAEMQWFRDAKFGMFIHWGLYALLGRGEWVMFNERISTSEYAKLADRFTIERFDAKAWARTAKNAGMKYMVLTARHHDGFSLFDTKASAYNSVNSAAKRDIVAEYVEACRAEGLKVGLYYSPMDWRFPGYFFPEMYFDNALAMRDQCHQQLEELMTNYGKIDLLWFDGEWLAHGGIRFGHDGWYREPDYARNPYFNVNYFWQSEKIVNRIRTLQPGIMINNRFSWEGDFHVRERRIGGMRTDKPWDSNDCLTDSWGYIPGKPMLSLRELIRNLVDITTRDGNYLLNVGPTGEGNLEDRQVNRLTEVGRWLDQYGHTLYGTRGGPILPGDWGGATHRGSEIYLHITEWKEDELVLAAPPARVTGYDCLTGGSASVVHDGAMIRVSVPEKQRHPYDTIIALHLDAPVKWDGIKAVEQDIYGLADGLQ